MALRSLQRDRDSRFRPIAGRAAARTLLHVGERQFFPAFRRHVLERAKIDRRLAFQHGAMLKPLGLVLQRLPGCVPGVRCGGRRRGRHRWRDFARLGFRREARFLSLRHLCLMQDVLQILLERAAGVAHRVQLGFAAGESFAFVPRCLVAQSRRLDGRDQLTGFP